MKRALKLGLFTLSIFCLGTSYAGIPNNDDPTTFLGPTVRGGFTSTLTDTTAYSLAAEAGLKNFRVGGTIGWKIMDNQRLKVSAEYLWQRITYAFFSGNDDEWVQQAAIGAAYRYDIIDCMFNPQFGVRAYLSHAPSKSLSTVTGSFVNSLGGTESFVDNRRIAGSNAAGISPNVSIQPWMGGRIGAELNYDNVRYDKNYPPNEDAKGFGGTVTLEQAIAQDVALGLSAAVRAPFNNYAAMLMWSNVPYFGEWRLGVGGDYTAGKNTLPNTWNVGVSADYFLDQRCHTSEAKVMALKGDYKGEVMQPIADDLVTWTADPAVYMPQVLAIPDDQVQLGCSPTPTVIGSITIPSITSPGVTTYPTAQAFSPSTGLIYSISVTPAPANGNNVVIDPHTGVITVTAATSQTLTATVTATNACGQAVTATPISIAITIVA